jgi:hypothetical protein
LEVSGLSKNIWFKVSLWGGFLLALIVTVIIILYNEFQWCSKVVCFSNFLEIFDVPIKIVSTSMALAAFVAVIDRSNKTKHQIDLSISQNVFKNFLDHRAEFYKTLDDLTADNDNCFKNRGVLYTILFPNNNMKNIEFTSSSKTEETPQLILFISQYNDLIDKLNNVLLKKNDNICIPNASVKAIARIIPDFLRLTMEACYYPNQVKKVESRWSGYINSDVFEGIPDDMELFISSFGNVLAQLVDFCFVNDDSENCLNPLLHPKSLNCLVDTLCVSVERE